MILTKKEEKLGKSEAVYYLLLSVGEKDTEYFLNIWDMKGQDDTLDLSLMEEILFFEDAIVIFSKKEYAMFINLNHVLSIDLVIKEA
ncbi:hypothetical protein [Methanobrevibacter sp.]|uniref:hypothetical protein n=1 Tax=Methanobrevibacter sp. TaxID=66852 RepID=UPI00388EE7EA